jgi:hypothetical protein
MALRQTGLADDIVILAFGLRLGAVAVAFGLGGRDLAARTLEDWRASTRTPLSKPEGRIDLHT